MIAENHRTNMVLMGESLSQSLVRKTFVAIIEGSFDWLGFGILTNIAALFYGTRHGQLKLVSLFIEKGRNFHFHHRI